MSIAFILAYDLSRHAGVVWTFINWTKELRRIGVRAEVVLYRASDSIAERLDELNIRYSMVNSVDELKRSLREGSYSYVITDDYIKRLELVASTVPREKLVIYAQVLYGIHAVFPLFKHSVLPLKHRSMLNLAKAIPFPALRHRYVRKLSKAQIIIANSGTTETLLYTLYGITPKGVVYPPVDTEVFKPRGTPKRNQAMLYLGSNAGDTNPNLVEKICRVLNQNGIDVISFGNKRLAIKLREKCKANYISNVPDEELAKLYSESLVTITPQTWETFGYVVAESIACGTPVIALAIVGSKEIISLTGLGVLARSEKDFLETLMQFRNLDTILNFAKRSLTDTDELPFSSKVTVSNMLSLILT